jgi:hypothetical protein
MNLRVAQNAVYFVIRWEPIRFSRRTLYLQYNTMFGSSSDATFNALERMWKTSSVTAIYYKNYIFKNRNVSRPGMSSYIHMKNKQLHIYKYIQLHITFFLQHASVTLVTIFRVSNNTNTINVKWIVSVTQFIIIIIFSGSTAQRGLWLPGSRGFLITHNDAPQSDEWSTRCRPLPDNVT